MTLELSLCKSCGKVFEPDEVEMGYCYGCAPDAGDLQEPEMDMNKLVGDCE